MMTRTPIYTTTFVRTFVRNSVTTCILLATIATIIASVFNPAHAKQYDSGDYIVYYNTLNANFITPEIAKKYQIQHGSHNGLLNVAVHRKNPNGDKPVIARITGQANPSNGQPQPLSFQMINEGNYIYYLAEVIISNQSLMEFELRIAPNPTTPPIKLTFSHNFFIDK